MKKILLAGLIQSMLISCTIQAASPAKSPAKKHQAQQENFNLTHERAFEAGYPTNIVGIALAGHVKETTANGEEHRNGPFGGNTTIKGTNVQNYVKVIEKKGAEKAAATYKEEILKLNKDHDQQVVSTHTTATQAAITECLRFIHNYHNSDRNRSPFAQNNSNFVNLVDTFYTTTKDTTRAETIKAATIKMKVLSGSDLTEEEQAVLEASNHADFNNLSQTYSNLITAVHTNLAPRYSEPLTKLQQQIETLKAQHTEKISDLENTICQRQLELQSLRQEHTACPVALTRVQEELATAQADLKQLNQRHVTLQESFDAKNTHALELLTAQYAQEKEALQEQYLNTLNDNLTQHAQAQIAKDEDWHKKQETACAETTKSTIQAAQDYIATFDINNAKLNPFASKNIGYAMTVLNFYNKTRAISTQETAGLYNQQIQTLLLEKEAARQENADALKALEQSHVQALENTVTIPDYEFALDQLSIILNTALNDKDIEITKLQQTQDELASTCLNELNKNTNAYKAIKDAEIKKLKNTLFWNRVAGSTGLIGLTAYFQKHALLSGLKSGFKNGSKVLRNSLPSMFSSMTKMVKNSATSFLLHHPQSPKFAVSAVFGLSVAGFLYKTVKAPQASAPAA